MHVLHAIHDFPPRHQAGSELYALALAQAQSARHYVTVLCADYNPTLEHGHVWWRVHQGVPVVEIINNWKCATFDETYRPRLITHRIDHVLRTLRPAVVHVHNLLNLSFDLPAVARSLGIPIVATLHDYTLVCASGGQRVHRRDLHVCHQIDTDRCARCFVESPFYPQVTLGRIAPTGSAARMATRVGVAARRLWPGLVSRAINATRHLSTMAVTASDVDARIMAARRVFDDVSLFVAPSTAIGLEFERLGLPRDRIRVADYGMPSFNAQPRSAPGRPLRIGFVGTLVWHKGVHVLVEAIAALPPGACNARIFGDLGTFPDYVAALRGRSMGLPIEFMGRFTKDRVPEIYAQFDVLVVPSLWPENSPLVIHEAFMAGVPVVGARIGGIPELVKDGVSGLLYDPSSSADLARVLQQLVDEPSRVTELAQAAPRVKSMTEDAAGWDAIYQEVAAAGTSVPA